MLTVLAAGTDSTEAIWLIGVLVVIGCVLAAAWCAFHEQVVAAVLLLIVAIFAGVLLL